MNLQQYKQLNLSTDNGMYYIERVSINGQLSTTVTENIEDVTVAAFIARVYNIPVTMSKEVLVALKQW